MTDLSALLAATTSTTTAPSKGSGGSSFTFIFLLAILAAFYFLIIRPRQARQRQARTQAVQLEMGATVMSVGGIKGTVVGLDDTDVRVEVAPGVVLTFIRRAVNAQAVPASSEAADSHGGDSYGSDSYGADRDPGVAGDDDRHYTGHDITKDDIGAAEGGDRGASDAADAAEIARRDPPKGTFGQQEPEERPGTGTEGS